MHVFILFVVLVSSLGGMLAVTDEPASMYIGYGEDDNHTQIALFDRQADGTYKKRQDTIKTGYWPYYMTTNKLGDKIYTLEENYDDDQAFFNLTVYSKNADTGKFEMLHTTDTMKDTYYLVLDDTEKFLLSADFATGAILSLIMKDDGSIEKTESFTITDSVGTANHRPYLVDFVPSPNKLVGVAYAGLDKVAFLEIDSDHKLSQPATPLEAKTAEGSFPVIFTFTGDGKYLYVLGLRSATITVFQVTVNDGTQKIEGFTNPKIYRTLPDGEKGGVEDFDFYLDDDELGGDARLLIHPNNKFVYAMNVYQPYIAIYAIEDTGILTLVEHKKMEEKFPFAMVITPEVEPRMMVSCEDGAVTIFKFESDGKLTKDGSIPDLADPGFILFPKSASA